MSVFNEAASAQVLPPGTWSIDEARSNVEFAIKHMALSTLRGRFGEFEGRLEIDGDAPRAGGTVRAASIDTGDPVRDAHLRDSSDFFDVQHHPEITFSSTRVAIAGGRHLRIEGQLSMRGTTRDIVLEGELCPESGDSPGQRRVGIHLRGELNRKDFGLTWNQALDAGGALLGNKVKIELSLSAFA